MKHDCQLCGAPGARMALVRWSWGEFEAIWRCPDVDACRRRVLAAGEAWPVSESREPVADGRLAGTGP